MNVSFSNAEAYWNEQLDAATYKWLEKCKLPFGLILWMDDDVPADQIWFYDGFKLHKLVNVVL